MINKRILLCVLIIAVGSLASADYVENIIIGSWSSAGGTSTDPDGNSFAFANGFGWIVEQVEYDGGFAASDSGNIFGSTTLMPNIYVPFKAFNMENMNGPEERDFYIRVYNSTNKTEATYYVNLGVIDADTGLVDAYYTAPVYPAGTVVEPIILSYEQFSGTTTDLQAHGQWIGAVPEAASISLIGLAAGGVLFVRRVFLI
ncbi:MAG: hypothetical protein K9M45_07080 [Kiritimatiellales bacterium]|nr:hypothetical protein [Kiritimatiellales bacterium]